MFWSPVSKAWPFFLQENPPLLLKDLQVLWQVLAVLSRDDGMEEEEAGNWVLELLVPSHLLVQFFVEQVSAPVLLGESMSCGVVLESGVHAGFENTLDNADFTGAGSENEFHDAQVVVPGAGAGAEE